VSTTIERLLLIQDRDRHLARLTREVHDIPKRKEEIEVRLETHTEALAAAQHDLLKCEADAHEIENEIESVKTKIRKYREQQLQIKSNTEYRALGREIEQAEERISQLEDKELEVLERTDTFKEAVKLRTQDLDAEKLVVSEDTVVLDKRLTEIEGEISKVQADRDALARDVDASWLSRYDRTMKHVGDYALVVVENSACGGCHMNLPPQVITDVKKGVSMVLCNYCGRILYANPY